MFKAFLFLPAALIGFCSAPDASAPPADMKNWPTLSQRLNCLPEAGALVAAHRGTSRGGGLAENGVQSLEALIAGGVRIVEIDVAQLKSGEHILFHDGVWEEKSTGRGPVAGSNWTQVQRYLLKDETGRATSDSPVLLLDYLRRAKGRAHVEIDFKSSAKYETVISYIKKSGMENDVILIAYSKGQAAKLARLAPEMKLSVPIKSLEDVKAYQKVGIKPQNLYAWTGRGEGGIETYLAAQNIPVLTSSKDKRAVGPAAIVVSDYALDLNPVEGVIGLSDTEQNDYRACLSQ